MNSRERERAHDLKLVVALASDLCNSLEMGFQIHYYLLLKVDKVVYRFCVNKENPENGLN